MDHLEQPTVQQLVMAACGALVVAGTLLARGNALGLLPLVVAVACGIGAFAKSGNR